MYTFIFTNLTRSKRPLLSFRNAYKKFARSQSRSAEEQEHRLENIQDAEDVHGENPEPLEAVEELSLETESHPNTPCPIITTEHEGILPKKGTSKPLILKARRNYHTSSVYYAKNAKRKYTTTRNIGSINDQAQTLYQNAVEESKVVRERQKKITYKLNQIKRLSDDETSLKSNDSRRSPKAKSKINRLRPIDVLVKPYDIEIKTFPKSKVYKLSQDVSPTKRKFSDKTSYQLAEINEPRPKHFVYVIGQTKSGTVELRKEEPRTPTPPEEVNQQPMHAYKLESSGNRQLRKFDISASVPAAADEAADPKVLKIKNVKYPESKHVRHLEKTLDVPNSTPLSKTLEAGKLKERFKYRAGKFSQSRSVEAPIVPQNPSCGKLKDEFKSKMLATTTRALDPLGQKFENNIREHPTRYKASKVPQMLRIRNVKPAPATIPDVTEEQKKAMEESAGTTQEEKETAVEEKQATEQETEEHVVSHPKLLVPQSAVMPTYSRRVIAEDTKRYDIDEQCIRDNTKGNFSAISDTYIDLKKDKSDTFTKLRPLAVARPIQRSEINQNAPNIKQETETEQPQQEEILPIEKALQRKAKMAVEELSNFVKKLQVFKERTSLDKQPEIMKTFQDRSQSTGRLHETKTLEDLNREARQAVVRAQTARSHSEDTRSIRSSRMEVAEDTDDAEALKSQEVGTKKKDQDKKFPWSEKQKNAIEEALIAEQAALAAEALETERRAATKQLLDEQMRVLQDIKAKATKSITDRPAITFNRLKTEGFVTENAHVFSSDKTFEGLAPKAKDSPEDLGNSEIVVEQRPNSLPILQSILTQYQVSNEAEVPRNLPRSDATAQVLQDPRPRDEEVPRKYSKSGVTEEVLQEAKSKKVKAAIMRNLNQFQSGVDKRQLQNEVLSHSKHIKDNERKERLKQNQPPAIDKRQLLNEILSHSKHGSDKESSKKDKERSEHAKERRERSQSSHKKKQHDLYDPELTEIQPQDISDPNKKLKFKLSEIDDHKLSTADINKTKDLSIGYVSMKLPKEKTASLHKDEPLYESVSDVNKSKNLSIRYMSLKLSKEDLNRTEEEIREEYEHLKNRGREQFLVPEYALDEIEEPGATKVSVEQHEPVKKTTQNKEHDEIEYFVDRNILLGNGAISTSHEKHKDDVPIKPNTPVEKGQKNQRDKSDKKYQPLVKFRYRGKKLAAMSHKELSKHTEENDTHLQQEEKRPTSNVVENEKQIDIKEESIVKQEPQLTQPPAFFNNKQRLPPIPKQPPPNEKNKREKAKGPKEMVLPPRSQNPTTRRGLESNYRRPQSAPTNETSSKYGIKTQSKDRTRPQSSRAPGRNANPALHLKDIIAKAEVTAKMNPPNPRRRFVNTVKPSSSVTSPKPESVRNAVRPSSVEIISRSARSEEQVPNVKRDTAKSTFKWPWPTPCPEHIQKKIATPNESYTGLEEDQTNLSQNEAEKSEKWLKLVDQRIRNDGDTKIDRKENANTKKKVPKPRYYNVHAKQERATEEEHVSAPNAKYKFKNEPPKTPRTSSRSKIVWPDVIQKKAETKQIDEYRNKTTEQNEPAKYLLDTMNKENSVAPKKDNIFEDSYVSPIKDKVMEDSCKITSHVPPKKEEVIEENQNQVILEETRMLPKMRVVIEILNADVPRKKEVANAHSTKNTEPEPNNIAELEPKPSGTCANLGHDTLDLKSNYNMENEQLKTDDVQKQLNFTSTESEIISTAEYPGQNNAVSDMVAKSLAREVILAETEREAKSAEMETEPKAENLAQEKDHTNTSEVGYIKKSQNVNPNPFFNVDYKTMYLSPNVEDYVLGQKVISFINFNKSVQGKSDVKNAEESLAEKLKPIDALEEINQIISAKKADMNVEYRSLMLGEQQEVKPETESVALQPEKVQVKSEEVELAKADQKEETLEGNESPTHPRLTNKIVMEAAKLLGRRKEDGGSTEHKEGKDVTPLTKPTIAKPKTRQFSTTGKSESNLLSDVPNQNKRHEIHQKVRSNTEVIDQKKMRFGRNASSCKVKEGEDKSGKKWMIELASPTSTSNDVSKGNDQNNKTAKSLSSTKTAVKSPNTTKAAVQSSSSTQAAIKNPNSTTTVVKSQSSMKTAVKSPSGTKAALKSLSSTKTAVKNPSNTKTAMKNPSSTSTAVKSPSSIKAAMESPSNSMKTAVQSSSSAKTAVKCPSSTKTAVQSSSSTQAAIKNPNSTTTVVKSQISMKTVVNSPSRTKAALKSLSSTKTAVKNPSNTKTAMKNPSSTATAVKSPSSIKAAMESPSNSMKTAVQTSSSAKTAVKCPSSTKTAVQSSSSTQAAIKNPNSTTTVVKSQISMKTAVNSPSRTKAAVRNTSSTTTAVKSPSSIKAAMESPTNSMKTAVKNSSSAKTAVKCPSSTKTAVKIPSSTKAAMKSPSNTKTAIKNPTVTVLNSPSSTKSAVESLGNVKSPSSRKTVVNSASSTKPAVESANSTKKAVKSASNTNTAIKSPSGTKRAVKSPSSTIAVFQIKPGGSFDILKKASEVAVIEKPAPSDSALLKKGNQLSKIDEVTAIRKSAPSDSALLKKDCPKLSKIEEEIKETCFRNLFNHAVKLLETKTERPDVGATNNNIYLDRLHHNKRKVNEKDVAETYKNESNKTENISTESKQTKSNTATNIKDLSKNKNEKESAKKELKPELNNNAKSVKEIYKNELVGKKDTNTKDTAKEQQNTQILKQSDNETKELSRKTKKVTFNLDNEKVISEPLNAGGTNAIGKVVLVENKTKVVEIYKNNQVNNSKICRDKRHYYTTDQAGHGNKNYKKIEFIINQSEIDEIFNNKNSKLESTLEGKSQKLKETIRKTREETQTKKVARIYLNRLNSGKYKDTNKKCGHVPPKDITVPREENAQKPLSKNVPEEEMYTNTELKDNLNQFYEDTSAVKAEIVKIYDRNTDVKPRTSKDRPFAKYEEFVPTKNQSHDNIVKANCNYNTADTKSDTDRSYPKLEEFLPNRNHNHNRKTYSNTDLLFPDSSSGERNRAKQFMKETKKRVAEINLAAKYISQRQQQRTDETTSRREKKYLEYQSQSKLTPPSFGEASFDINETPSNDNFKSRKVYSSVPPEHKQSPTASVKPPRSQSVDTLSPGKRCILENNRDMEIFEEITRRPKTPVANEQGTTLSKYNLHKEIEHRRTHIPVEATPLDVIKTPRRFPKGGIKVKVGTRKIRKDILLGIPNITDQIQKILDMNRADENNKLHDKISSKIQYVLTDTKQKKTLKGNRRGQARSEPNEAIETGASHPSENVDQLVEAKQEAEEIKIAQNEERQFEKEASTTDTKDAAEHYTSLKPKKEHIGDARDRLRKYPDENEIQLKPTEVTKASASQSAKNVKEIVELEKNVSNAFGKDSDTDTIQLKPSEITEASASQSAKHVDEAVELEQDVSNASRNTLGKDSDEVKTQLQPSAKNVEATTELESLAVESNVGKTEEEAVKSKLPLFIRKLFASREDNNNSETISKPGTDELKTSEEIKPVSAEFFKNIEETVKPKKDSDTVPAIPTGELKSSQEAKPYSDQSSKNVEGLIEPKQDSMDKHFSTSQINKKTEPIPILAAEEQKEPENSGETNPISAQSPKTSEETVESINKLLGLPEVKCDTTPVPKIDAAEQKENKPISSQSSKNLEEAVESKSSKLLDPPEAKDDTKIANEIKASKETAPISAHTSENVEKTAQPKQNAKTNSDKNVQKTDAKTTQQTRNQNTIDLKKYERLNILEELKLLTTPSKNNLQKIEKETTSTIRTKNEPNNANSMPMKEHKIQEELKSPKEPLNSVKNVQKTDAKITLQIRTKNNTLLKEHEGHEETKSPKEPVVKEIKTEEPKTKKVTANTTATIGFRVDDKYVENPKSVLTNTTSAGLNHSENVLKTEKELTRKEDKADQTKKSTEETKITSPMTPESADKSLKPKESTSQSNPPLSEDLKVSTSTKKAPTTILPKGMPYAMDNALKSFIETEEKIVREGNKATQSLSKPVTPEPFKEMIELVEEKVKTKPVSGSKKLLNKKASETLTVSLKPEEVKGEKVKTIRLFKEDTPKVDEIKTEKSKSSPIPKETQKPLTKKCSLKEISQLIEAKRHKSKSNLVLDEDHTVIIKPKPSAKETHREKPKTSSLFNEHSKPMTAKPKSSLNPVSRSSKVISEKPEANLLVKDQKNTAVSVDQKPITKLKPSRSEIPKPINIRSEKPEDSMLLKNKNAVGHNQKTIVKPKSSPTDAAPAAKQLKGRHEANVLLKDSKSVDVKSKSSAVAQEKPHALKKPEAKLESKKIIKNKSDLKTIITPDTGVQLETSYIERTPETSKEPKVQLNEKLQPKQHRYACDGLVLPAKNPLSQVVSKESIESPTTMLGKPVGDKITKPVKLPPYKPGPLDKYKHLKTTFMTVKNSPTVMMTAVPGKPEVMTTKKFTEQELQILILKFDLLKRMWREFKQQEALKPKSNFDRVCQYYDNVTNETTKDAVVPKMPTRTRRIPEIHLKPHLKPSFDRIVKYYAFVMGEEQASDAEKKPPAVGSRKNDDKPNNARKMCTFVSEDGRCDLDENNPNKHKS